MRSWTLVALFLLLGLLLGIIALLGVFEAITYRGTVFAPGYSEEQFRQVHRGMTQSQVRSLLGPPLQRYEGYWGYWSTGVFEVWQYSRKRAGESWWQGREVFFDLKTKRVYDTARELHDP